MFPAARLSAPTVRLTALRQFPAFRSVVRGCVSLMAAAQGSVPPLTAAAPTVSQALRPLSAATGDGRRGKAPKLLWLCTDCGDEAGKWSGKCGACGAWNTLKEFKVPPASAAAASPGRAAGSAAAAAAAASGSAAGGSGWVGGTGQPAVKLGDVPSGFEAHRVELHSAELNRLLGGGLTRGSVVLLGGPPGVGKSTLLLSLAQQLCGAQPDRPSVLYVSGEESVHQVKQRADRLGVQSPHLLLLHETNLLNVLDQVRSLGDTIGAVVVDSIQTMELPDVAGLAGSPTQIRASTVELTHLAKQSGVPVVLSGHITKSGEIAGPRLLEHLVDTVLYMESAGHSHRVVRSQKNRFGSAVEVGLFDMTCV